MPWASALVSRVNLLPVAKRFSGCAVLAPSLSSCAQMGETKVEILSEMQVNIKSSKYQKSGRLIASENMIVINNASSHHQHTPSKALLQKNHWAYRTCAVRSERRLADCVLITGTQHKHIRTHHEIHEPQTKNTSQALRKLYNLKRCAST